MAGPTNPATPTALAIVQALPNAVFAVDGDDRVIFANAACEHFFRASANALRQMKVGDLVAFSSPLLDLLQHVRSEEASINEYGVSIGTPGRGGERIVDLQAAPASDIPGAVVVMLQVRSMADLINRQLTQRDAVRSLTGMATMLAHEIKNPLAGIRGAAQLLEPALSADEQAMTRLICDETDRIRDLIDQMEVFSDERPVSGNPVNMHAVIDHVRRVIAASCSDGIVFQEDFDPSLPPVPGERDQLIQVVMNLMKNAVEAVEAAGGVGEIVLATAFRPGVRMRVPGVEERISLPFALTIENTGAGIPDDLRPRLFDPFITTKPGGRGLGLALVAKIVRDHGGIVECDSKSGRTRFRVLLPIAAERSHTPGGAAIREVAR